ncbi:MAG: hypothetical protein KME20_10860 [Kaiparowitsia implicata GSE-PSE-MK54-09C]|jgi:hypothetical protein|nr:hypothetical protein [Kaiparowitsia implicata GSE-PSE-MK54-09C]
MQVNVFITRSEGQLQSDLLVLPMSPQSAIPPKYRTGWTYYATVDTGDRMFGDLDALAIENELAAAGFAIVTPQTPDRR